VIPEAIHQFLCVLPEPDDHQCLEADANSGWIDVCVKSAEDTLVPQALHPLRTRRRCDPDSGGKCLVGEATIVLEEFDNAPVCSVENGTGVH
jgi:hypothetical protein